MKPGLGSCRLEINGLGPGGQQPFSNKDGTIHAVVNGELYDHQRIRDDMIELSGYKFKGGSDSEIVMALYEHYGISFLSQLRGEYALCLYDAKKQLFLAARDRSGIKPLFWTVHDGRLLLASEAKALLPLGWRPEWDVRSIIDKGWLTEERTVFKELRKVSRKYVKICNLTPSRFGLGTTSPAFRMITSPMANIGIMTTQKRYVLCPRSRYLRKRFHAILHVAAAASSGR